MQAAGSASGDKVYVEDVFSTHLYTGTGSTTQSINNGMDLSGTGGLVWAKPRSSSGSNSLYDTERGVQKALISNATGGNQDDSGGGGTAGLYQFNSNGFSLGDNYAAAANNNNEDMVAWTFLKQEGFFDVVTWTGNATIRTISHNLGCVPGFIIIKRLDTSSHWVCYHKSVGPTKWLYLNNTNAALDDDTAFNDTAPTSSVFTVGTMDRVNSNGGTHVAYLFADGDSSDAQIFGEDGDEAIIKTGTYQSDGNGNEVYVDLGFEPQWIMIKSSTDTQSWIIQDNMRGMAHSTSTNNYLLANSNGAENSEGTAGMVRAESNGMTIGVAGIINMFNSVQTYTYMAIRRGPMKEPSAGTDVYNYQTRGGGGSGPPAYIFPHPVDMFFQRELGQSDDWYSGNRLIGLNVLKPDETDALASQTFLGAFDYQNGFGAGTGTASAQIAYAWRRYPKVFDIVVYEGNGSNSPYRTINHNLGVAPELVIIKNIDSSSAHWGTGANTGNSDVDGRIVYLNLTGAYNGDGLTASATTVTLDGGFGGTSATNTNNNTHLMLMFASLSGISKVGAYVGTGSAINVDCGFSGGARWVMVKRTDATADWYIVSSGRGFGKHLKVDSDADESSTAVLDTLSAGFTVRSDAGDDLNASGGKYLFLAFA
jgi:hypothetical protein